MGQDDTEEYIAIAACRVVEESGFIAHGVGTGNRVNAMTQAANLCNNFIVSEEGCCRPVLSEPMYPEIDGLRCLGVFAHVSYALQGTEIVDRFSTKGTSLDDIVSQGRAICEEQGIPYEMSGLRENMCDGERDSNCWVTPLDAVACRLLAAGCVRR